MKKLMITYFTIFLCVLPFSNSPANNDAFFDSLCAENELKFLFCMKSAVLIKVSKKTILIDPARYITKETFAKLKDKGLDLMLFIHDHFDHYHYSTALNIFKATGAHIVASPVVANELKKGIPKEKITVSSHKEKHKLNGIDITAIEGKHTCPIYLYYIKVGNIRIFHGGDSSYVSLVDYPSDVAFVPVGSPCRTCSPEDAFKMVKDLKPQVAVTMHGLPVEYEEFNSIMKSRLASTSVVIPNKFEFVALKIGK